MLVNHPKKMGCCQLSSFGNLCDKWLTRIMIATSNQIYTGSTTVASFTVGSHSIIERCFNTDVKV